MKSAQHANLSCDGNKLPRDRKPPTNFACAQALIFKKKKPTAYIAAGQISFSWLVLSSHPWHSFGSKRHRRSFHGPAIAYRHLTCDSSRLRSSRWHCQVFPFGYKRQAVLFAVPIDANQVAQLHLIGSQQIRQRIHDVALNRALQVPRAIALVRSFLQQEFAARASNAEQKLPFCRLQYS